MFLDNLRKHAANHVTTAWGLGLRSNKISHFVVNRQLRSKYPIHNKNKNKNENKNELNADKQRR